MTGSSITSMIASSMTGTACLGDLLGAFLPPSSVASFSASRALLASCVQAWRLPSYVSRLSCAPQYASLLWPWPSPVKYAAGEPISKQPNSANIIRPSRRYCLPPSDRHRQAALAHRTRLSGTQAGGRARAFRGAWVARIPSPRHPVHRSLRIPDLRAGDDSPLRTSFHHAVPEICRTQRLPTQRIHRDGPSVTSKLDRNHASTIDRRARQKPATMSLLQLCNRKTVTAQKFMTQ